MLPKTLWGWIVLIVIISVLIWGPALAGEHLGNAVHQIITGTRAFFAGLAN